MKVGIIGFGLSGKVFHAGLLKHDPGFEISGVVSSRPSDVQHLLPSAKVYSSPTELFSSDVDVIVNAAPNSQHFSLSLEALRSGKHVVVEKPFVNSSSDGRALIEAAENSNRFLTVFQNRRWDGDFLTARKLIETGRLGQIVQFESHMDRWRPVTRAERWREQADPGSGILFDLGSHLIDQALVSFGKPDAVSADLAQQKQDAKTDDYFHLILHYGRMRAILHSSSFSPGTPRFQIFGTKASYVKFGVDPQESQLRDEISSLDPRFGRDSQGAYGHLRTGDSEQTELIETEPGQYCEFYSRLHSAIVNQDASQLPVHPHEALQVIELIEAAQESSRSGRRIEF